MTAFGLAARVNITGAEAANDRLTVNLLAGDDVVDASGVAAGSIQLTLDGGASTMSSSAATATTPSWADPATTCSSAAPGIDTLDGGGDDDVIIQLVGDDAVTSARSPTRVAQKNARIVDGKTVLDVGGKQRTLPRADLSQLVQDV